MRKQLIFLMTDTTRKDMVGCYGNPKMKTPNLDRQEVQSSLVHFRTRMAW